MEGIQQRSQWCKQTSQQKTSIQSAHTRAWPQKEGNSMEIYTYSFRGSDNFCNCIHQGLTNNDTLDTNNDSPMDPPLWETYTGSSIVSPVSSRGRNSGAPWPSLNARAVWGERRANNVQFWSLSPGWGSLRVLTRSRLPVIVCWRMKQPSHWPSWWQHRSRDFWSLLAVMGRTDPVSFAQKFKETLTLMFKKRHRLKCWKRSFFVSSDIKVLSDVICLTSPFPHVATTPLCSLTRALIKQTELVQGRD